MGRSVCEVHSACSACLLSTLWLGKAPRKASCQFRRSAICRCLAQGGHRMVRVEGVLLTGLEGGYHLVAAGCSGRSTYVEFALKTHRNWRRLKRTVNKTYRRTHSFG